jgi:hypothetical protein
LTAISFPATNHLHRWLAATVIQKLPSFFYQFCPSYNRRETRGYWQFLMETRDATAAQFRKKHGCSLVANGVEQANVVPYFIGVFDTVAALGHKYMVRR